MGLSLRHKTIHGGFTLIELLMSILVLLIGVIGIIAFLVKLNAMSGALEQHHVLSFLIEKKIEGTKQTRSYLSDSGNFSEEGYPDITYQLGLSSVQDLEGLLRLELYVQWEERGEQKSDRVLTYVNPNRP